jgi:hypothetical protein
VLEQVRGLGVDLERVFLVEQVWVKSLLVHASIVIQVTTRWRVRLFLAGRRLEGRVDVLVGEMAEDVLDLAAHRRACREESMSRFSPRSIA